MDFTKLEASLKAETDAETAVTNLIVALGDALKKVSAACTDTATKAKLDQLVNESNARTAALSAAVVAGTPAA